MNQWKKLALVAVAVIALAATMAGVAVSGEKPAAKSDEAPAAEQAPAKAELRGVPNAEVCMVNDRFFAREQIPVEVEEQTYYGCCEMCKTRLAEDEAVRFALDPVTGDKVDKASAVIAVQPDDSVLYFSSQETFEKYLSEHSGS